MVQTYYENRDYRAIAFLPIRLHTWGRGHCIHRVLCAAPPLPPQPCVSSPSPLSTAASSPTRPTRPTRPKGGPSVSRAAYRKHANPILVNRLDFDRSPAPILLSARQAAAMLDVCYDTMTARMRAGKVPTVEINGRRWVVVSSADSWYRASQSA